MADDLEAIRVADAVLYEGYLLYPYRRSSGKNRVRWQFGVLFPRAWAREHGLTDTGVAGSAESWWQQTECLIEPAGGHPVTVTARLRFLQLIRRFVTGDGHPSDARFFDEAVPRRFDLEVPLGDLPAAGRRVRLTAPGGVSIHPRTDAAGRPVAGRVVRRRLPVTAMVTITAEHGARAADAPAGREALTRLRIRVDNGGGIADPTCPREEALRSALLATHTLLTVRGGAFVSLLDPPAWARPAAERCVNVHTFPVLAGAGGGRATVLSAPILLYDHPRVAPESPGDLFDATEIDEILSLRTLTLTDAEKREARATDRRAAAIIDRVEAMSPQTFGRLHGTVRSVRPIEPRAGAAGRGRATFPDQDGARVVVAGTVVRRGSRVRLRPRRRGSDPQDLFLDGRTAVVEAVLRDVDGSDHLAVTVESDPGAELNRWYGRFRYFSPDEVEPLARDVEDAVP